jgi:hypothetical protein
MRNLYNMIALIAVAFTMFYLGRSCTLQEVGDCPDATIDSVEYTRTIKKLDSTLHVLDSIKEENREMDITIVNQQDQLRITNTFLNTTEKRADSFATLYRKAKLRNDAPAMARNCDSIVTEYETYRFACDSYVQETDSIMSNMYVVNQRQDKMIKDLNGLVDELSMKYMESQSATMIAATGEQAEQRKKKRWRRISIILASVIGLNLITR